MIRKIFIATILLFIVGLLLFITTKKRIHLKNGFNAKDVVCIKIKNKGIDSLKTDIVFDNPEIIKKFLFLVNHSEETKNVNLRANRGYLDLEILLRSNKTVSFDILKMVNKSEIIFFQDDFFRDFYFRNDSIISFIRNN